MYKYHQYCVIAQVKLFSGKVISSDKEHKNTEVFVDCTSRDKSFSFLKMTSLNKTENIKVII